jgi:hypothetical protein
MRLRRPFTFMASCLVTAAVYAALPACSSSSSNQSTNDNNQTPPDSSTDSPPEATTPDTTPDADKDVTTNPGECDAAAPSLTDALAAYDGGLPDCVAYLRENHASDLAACQQSCGCAAFVLGCFTTAPPPQTVGAIHCLSAAPTPAINAIFIAIADEQRCYPDAGTLHDAAADVDAPDAHDAAAE